MPSNCLSGWIGSQPDGRFLGPRLHGVRVSGRSVRKQRAQRGRASRGSVSKECPQKGQQLDH